MERLLEKATSSDVVTFDHDGCSHTLFAALDVENGGLRWLKDFREDASIIQHLRTKRWLAPMLHDDRRNRFYEASISKALSNGEAPGRVNVLDIGTGTGLLALLSARCSNDARVVSVSSYEMAGPMCALAKRIVASSSSGDKIEIVERHSRDVAPFETAPYLLTSELLDYQLIGEGILPTLRDLHSRSIIAKSTVVIPSRARLHAVLVGGGQGGLGIETFTELPNSQCYGISFLKSDYGNCSVSVVPFQDRNNANVSGISKVFEPFSDFVFSDPDLLPTAEGRVESCRVKLEGNEDDAAVVGVKFWFSMDALEGVADDDAFFYSSAGQFQDHWPASIYLFPPNKRKPAVGTVEIVACHSDSEVWFDIHDIVEAEETGAGKKRKREGCGRPPLPPFSSSRLRMLHSPARQSFFAKSLHELCDKEEPLIDISDFGLLAVMASKMGFKAVSSLESSNDAAKVLYAARVAQVGNTLDAAKFRVLQGLPETINKADLLGSGQARVVVGEGFYNKMEENVVLSGLNHFYTVRGLRKKGLIAASGVSYVPSRIKVMGYLVEFRDLSNVYKTLPPVCGIVHDKFNELGPGLNQSYDYPFYINLQSYDYIVKSETFELLRLQIASDDCKKMHEACPKILPQFHKAGGKTKIDALVTWVDFESTGGEVLSTNDEFHKQNVRFLKGGGIELGCSEEHNVLKVAFTLPQGSEADYAEAYDIQISVEERDV